MEKEDFLSLFDYLGKAAGSDLGKNVYLEAKKLNQPMKQRQVTTKNYTGKIMLYQREFLQNYLK